MTCEFLKISGYSVLQAQNGTEALEIVTQHTGKIHLVLTDVVMPRMSGSELAERVKSIRPDTKILFMSGYSVPVQTVDATLACSLLTGVWKPRVFLGR